MYDIKKLRPVHLNDLIRIGSKNDGGYVVPERTIRKTDILLSFGINADWNFEKEFLRKKENCSVYAFDASVSSLKMKKKAFSRFIHSVGHTIAGNKERAKYKLEQAANLWSFGDFFGKQNIHFYKKFLGKKSAGKFTNFEYIFNNILTNKQPPDLSVFLKMDIEGAEMEVLPQLAPYFNKINAIAAEFHKLDKNGTALNEITKMLSNNFCVAHIHANNIGGYIDGTKLPKTLEISFINRALLTEPILPSTASYPLAEFDTPCDPSFPDLPILFD